MMLWVMSIEAISRWRVPSVRALMPAPKVLREHEHHRFHLPTLPIGFLIKVDGHQPPPTVGRQRGGRAAMNGGDGRRGWAAGMSDTDRKYRVRVCMSPVRAHRAR